MANTEQTFHMSKEQHRKMEFRTSKRNKGRIPKTSEAAFMQSVIDKNRARTSHPVMLEPPALWPPVTGHSSCTDPTKTGKGIGGRIHGAAAFETRRDPTTQASAVRLDGKEWHRETTL